MTAGVLSRVAPFFFFNDTATTEIYTLSLHDALPISGARRHERRLQARRDRPRAAGRGRTARHSAVRPPRPDRKSTRLNSSHANISYAVFCLKKKNDPNSVLLFTRVRHFSIFNVFCY